MGINKVQYGNTTLIDLTADTVTADKLLQGYTAHDRTGAVITGTATGGSGSGVVWQDVDGYVHLSDEGDIPLQTKTVTPSETAQTVTPDSGYYALQQVNVGAISSTYVGSGITHRSSSDLTASGATVTVPSGYYSAQASKAVTSGTVTAPNSISGTSATVSTGTNTLTLSKTVSVTPNVTTAGYISSGTAGNSSVSLTASISTRSSSDLTVSGATVTVPSGYYSTNASKAVATGTAGTPTATKGTVSNHSITVTPSVTNTTGYITGGTKTGTAVTVSASELVSGSETKTANGTYDVTNLASLVVNVSGGGGGGLVYESGTWEPTSNISTATISFQNVHTTTPFMYVILDISDHDSSDTYSNKFVIFTDFDAVFGTYLPINSTGSKVYGQSEYGYFPSSATISYSTSRFSTSTAKNTWVTSAEIKPSTSSASRYWKAGRTYKWIAVWPPT